MTSNSLAQNIRAIQQVLGRATAQFFRAKAALGPVWRNPMPLGQEIQGGNWNTLALGERSEREVLDFFLDKVLPYATGNSNPKFLGWVHGGGDAIGLPIGFISLAMNSNLGGRNHGAVHIEQALQDLCKDLFGFPDSSSSVVVGGTSEANLLGLLIARRRLEELVGSAQGLQGVVYCSEAAHLSVARACKILGIQRVRRIPPTSNRDDRMDLFALQRVLESDRKSHLRPIAIVATAGYVDSGTSDCIRDVVELASDFDAWVHLDGAFGVWKKLAPATFGRDLEGLELVDSLAFDFHKWTPAHFSSAMLICRDKALHLRALGCEAPYLEQNDLAMFGGEWSVNFGISLSRSFQSAIPFAVLHKYGKQLIGQHVAYSIVLASYFSDLIAQSCWLVPARPTLGNVVLFRTRCPRISARQVAAHLQEAGETVFSTTRISGREVLRACFVNFDTRPHHVEGALIELEDACASLCPCDADRDHD